MNQIFEQELNQIEHYKKFPLMKPFVGENYENSKKKFLFVAESHFFDMDESKITEDYINCSPSKWYSSTIENLHESKHNWINTRNVVEKSTHMVFRELEKVLAISMEKYNKRAINNIAFMNGFQRPANKYGASIAGIACERDFVEGAKTINAVIRVIKPNYVIFISKYTWQKIASRLIRVEGIKYEFIYHPASIKYWNDKKNSNSKYKLLKLLS